MAGRPTKLTPETHDRIVQAIKLGATYVMAANYGGVSYDSFNLWMKQGEAAKSGLFFDFYNAVKMAEAQGAVGWLVKIEAAANDGAWQAAAWKLERRYPQDYGRTVVDQNVNQSGSLEHVIIDIGAKDDRRSITTDRADRPALEQDDSTT